MGTRQAHFLPALAEGVQGVVVLEDLTARAGSAIQPAFGSAVCLGGDAVRSSSSILFNPNNSGKVLRVRRVYIRYAQGSGIPANIHLRLAFMTSPPAGADFNNAATEFFQDTSYSHVGWPDTLTTIRSPVGVVAGGRSTALGATVAVLLHDTNQQVPHPIEFEFDSFVLAPMTAALVQTDSTNILDFLRVAWQWTEEPIRGRPAS
jgi:hypothetical protein